MSQESNELKEDFCLQRWFFSRNSGAFCIRSVEYLSLVKQFNTSDIYILEAYRLTQYQLACL